MKTGDREKGEVVGVFIKVYWRDVGLNFFQCCVFISLKYIICSSQGSILFATIKKSLLYI